MERLAPLAEVNQELETFLAAAAQVAANRDVNASGEPWLTPARAQALGQWLQAGGAQLAAAASGVRAQYAANLHQLLPQLQVWEQQLDALVQRLQAAQAWLASQAGSGHRPRKLRRP